LCLKGGTQNTHDLIRVLVLLFSGLTGVWTFFSIGGSFPPFKFCFFRPHPFWGPGFFLGFSGNPNQTHSQNKKPPPPLKGSGILVVGGFTSPVGVMLVSPGQIQGFLLGGGSGHVGTPSPPHNFPPTATSHGGFGGGFFLFWAQKGQCFPPNCFVHTDEPLGPMDSCPLAGPGPFLQSPYNTVKKALDPPCALFEFLAKKKPKQVGGGHPFFLLNQFSTPWPPQTPKNFGNTKTQLLAGCVQLWDSFSFSGLGGL